MDQRRKYVRGVARPFDVTGRGTDFKKDVLSRKHFTVVELVRGYLISTCDTLDHRMNRVSERLSA